MFWFRAANIAVFWMMPQWFELQPLSAGLQGHPVLPGHSQAEGWQRQWGAWLCCRFPLRLWWLIPQFPDGPFVSVRVGEGSCMENTTCVCEVGQEQGIASSNINCLLIWDIFPHQCINPLQAPSQRGFLEHKSCFASKFLLWQSSAIIIHPAHIIICRVESCQALEKLKAPRVLRVKNV